MNDLLKAFFIKKQKRFKVKGENNYNEDKVGLRNRILDCTLALIPKLPNVTLRRPYDIYHFLMYWNTNYALTLFGCDCIAYLLLSGSMPAITVFECCHCERISGYF